MSGESREEFERDYKDPLEEFLQAWVFENDWSESTKETARVDLRNAVAKMEGRR